MKSINRVVLAGRLGADPEGRSFPSGAKTVSFDLATDESYKDRNTGQLVEATEWHRVVAFGRNAELIEQYTRKGSRLYVEGKNKTRKWQDKDGNQRFITEVIVEDFMFLDKPNQQGGKVSKAQPAPQLGTVSHYEYAEGDDIPFP